MIREGRPGEEVGEGDTDLYQTLRCGDEWTILLEVSMWITGYTLAFRAGPLGSRMRTRTEDRRSFSDDISILLVDIIHMLYLQPRISANGAAT